MPNDKVELKAKREAAKEAFLVYLRDKKANLRKALEYFTQLYEVDIGYKDVGKRVEETKGLVDKVDACIASIEALRP